MTLNSLKTGISDYGLKFFKTFKVVLSLKLKSYLVIEVLKMIKTVLTISLWF